MIKDGEADPEGVCKEPARRRREPPSVKILGKTDGVGSRREGADRAT